MSERGNDRFGTTRTFRNVRYLVAIGGAGAALSRRPKLNPRRRERHGAIDEDAG